MTNSPSPSKFAFRKCLRALGVIAILSVVCVAGVALPIRAMRARAEADRAALRPGMDVTEVFAAARGWAWGHGSGSGEAAGGQSQSLQLTAYGDQGIGVSGPEGRDESFPDRDAFRAGVARRREEFAACTKWQFIYRASVTPAKAFLSVEMEGGKVTRVGALATGD